MFMNNKVSQIKGFIPQRVTSISPIITCIKYLVNSTSSKTPESRFLLQCSGPDGPEAWLVATSGYFYRKTFKAVMN